MLPVLFCGKLLGNFSSLQGPVLREAIAARRAWNGFVCLKAQVFSEGLENAKADPRPHSQSPLQEARPFPTRLIHQPSKATIHQAHPTIQTMVQNTTPKQSNSPQTTQHKDPKHKAPKQPLISPILQPKEVWSQRPSQENFNPERGNDARKRN